MELPTKEECQVYSPESTDGKTDWPTKLVVSAFVIAACSMAMWGVGVAAQRAGVAPWWSVFN